MTFLPFASYKQTVTDGIGHFVIGFAKVKIGSFFVQAGYVRNFFLSEVIFHPIAVLLKYYDFTL